jgi:hypothetical protein
MSDSDESVVPGRYTKPESWAALAVREGGLIEPGRGQRIRLVTFPHRLWSITLEEYTESSGETSQKFTRFRVRYCDRSAFRLRIIEVNVFLRIAKRFGLQDIAVPAPALDERFVIRSSNESVVRSLVLSPAVQEPLLALRRVRVAAVGVRRRLRTVPDVSELRCYVPGRVKEEERLCRMLRLTRALLDGLARTGVATALPDAD